MSDNVRRLRAARAPWDITSHAAPGAQFVTPEQYLQGIPDTVRRSMVKDIVTRALAAAANPDGELRDFHPAEFFTTHVANVLHEAMPSDEIIPLTYDTFTAMTLTDCMTTLAIHDKLLANRGNGDSVDYRLTLPPT
jgi:hypothetical protein